MRSWARRQASGVASDIPERSTLWRMQLYLKPCLAVLGWVIGMRRTERTRERLQNSGVKRIALLEVWRAEDRPSLTSSRKEPKPP